MAMMGRLHLSFLLLLLFTKHISAQHVATVTDNEKIKAAFSLEKFVGSFVDQASQGVAIDVEGILTLSSTQTSLNNTLHYLGISQDESELKETLETLKSHSSLVNAKLSGAFSNSVDPTRTQTNIDFNFGDFGISMDEQANMSYILQSFGVSQENKTIVDYLHSNLSLPPDGELRMKYIFQELGLLRPYVLRNRIVFSKSSANVPEDEEPLEVDPNTAAKVQAAFEYTEQISSDLEALQALKKIEELVSETKLLKHMQRIGRLMKFVSSSIPYVSIAIDLFFTLFEPDEFAKLHERFDEVMTEFEILSNKIDNIISSNRWDNMLRDFNDYEGSITNFYDSMFSTTVDKFRLASTQRRRDKIAYEYVMKFDEALISEKIFKLTRIIALPESLLTKNIFDSLVNAENCDINKLDEIFTHALSVFTKGLTVEMAYYNFRGEKAMLNKTMEEARKAILGIYNCYNKQLSLCKHNPKTSAITIINKELDANKGTSASQLRKTLESRLPWYEWAVVYYDNDDNFDLDIRKRHWYGFGYASHVGTVRAKGNYAKISSKKVLFSWHDTGKSLRACCEINSYQDTVAFFRKPKDISAGNGAYSSSSCSLSHWVKHCFKIESWSYFSDNKGYFIANKNPSSFDKCNCLRGQCFNVNYGESRQRYCSCPDYYYGERCEQNYDPYISKMFLDMQQELGDSFFQSEGIKDVIDIYYEVLEIKDLMKLFEERIQNSLTGLEDALIEKHDNLQDTIQRGYSKIQNTFIKGYAKLETALQEKFTYTNMLSLYGESYLDAHYIAETYHELLQNEITVEVFGNRMQKVDFAKALFSLESLILGKDMLLPFDIIDIYRDFLIGKDIVPNCIENQAKLIVKLQTSLKSLDFYVSKAKLKYAQWMFETQGADDYILTSAKDEVDKSVGRMEQYSKLWESQLCPKLNVSGISDYCMMNYPYEGLIVNNTIECPAEDEYPYPPSVSSISCVKSNDTFRWNISPECRHLSCPELEKQTTPSSVLTGMKASFDCRLESTTNLTGYCVHDEVSAEWLLKPRCVCRESKCTNWMNSTSETIHQYERECCGQQQTFNCSSDNCPVLSLLNLIHDVCTDTYSSNFWEECLNEYPTLQCLQLWTNSYYYCNFVIVTEM